MSSADARVESLAGRATTWILGDDDDVIVIDPGADAAPVLAAVGGREILAVICTHGHAAHTAAALEVAARDEAAVALHPLERAAWREVHGTQADIDMEDGGRFEVGGVTLEVVHAPGHSRGSVLLYCDELDVAFTGDIVSAAGPVPHFGAFPDWGRQLDAIGARVLTLPVETRLLPGHGEEFTVAEADKRFNAWYSAGPDLADSAWE